MSYGSARRRFVVITNERSPVVAPRRGGDSDAFQSSMQLVSAVAAIVLGSIALVQALDLALDQLHGWIG